MSQGGEEEVPAELAQEQGVAEDGSPPAEEQVEQATEEAAPEEEPAGEAAPAENRAAEENEDPSPGNDAAEDTHRQEESPEEAAAVETTDNPGEDGDREVDDGEHAGDTEEAPAAAEAQEEPEQGQDDMPEEVFDADAASMTESRLTESEPDEDAVAGERDELLASLLDDTLIEDMAAKIEGFDDDFAEPEDEQEEVPEEDLETQDLMLDERILEAKRRWDAGMELHRLLESRISAHLQAIRGGQQGGAPEEKQGAVKFHNQLSKWQARRLEKVRMTEDHERRLAEMRVALEEKRRKADEITKTFRSFVAEVAKGSESSRSGQGIAQREVRAYFAKLAEKDEELQKVRLKAVQLRSRFDRAEATMRSKEQLAPGLHLIDFEQLKIENQSLNEKIEERNEELSKLSRKAMASVLVLTHVKEKLQFVEKENLKLVQRLEELEGSLSSKKDKLQDLKLHRDKSRQRVARMREQKTTVSQPMLIDDLQQQRLRRNELKAQVERAKEMFATLSTEVAGLRVRASTTDTAHGMTRGSMGAMTGMTSKSGVGSAYGAKGRGGPGIGVGNGG